MLTFQLKQVLRGKLPSFQFHNIYLVRENDVVFYIGQAADAPDRIKQHFGISASFGGVHAFANLILGNKPNSKKWQVNFYTTDDCRKVLGVKHLPRYKHVVNQWPPSPPFNRLTKKEWLRFNKIAHECRFVDDAEREMIRRFRPCFNGTYNEHPSPLPPKYQRWERHEAMRRIGKI